MASKWQTGIYCIHNTNKITEDVHSTLEDETKSYEQKQRKLSSKLLGVDSDYKYSSQKLLSHEQEGFELFLFYRKHKKESPEWKSFFKNQVEDTATINTNPVNMNESFIFFLHKKDTKKLYVISGGYGAFTIQNFVYDDFGINILIRIVANKGDRVLRHAKEFGVTGGLIGTAKYFRNNYNFYENKNFGNIYREISASIDKDTALSLGIPADCDKQCIAKNSFKVNHSLSFEEMLNLVNKLDEILQRNINFDVNDIKQVDIKKNEALIKILERKVLDDVWNNRLNVVVLDERLDFINKNFENFLQAKSYKFSRGVHEGSSNLFEWIMNRFSKSTKTEFMKNVHIQNVTALDGDDILSSDTVFNHFVYELEYDSVSYFLINGKYYQITESFKTTLNQSCKDYLDSHPNRLLNKIWNDGDTEGVYNLQYINEANTLVLDTVTPENIEPCDILKHDDEYVYLYHVKKGFNGSMRDLTNQVFIAASRIQEDLLKDRSYLKSVFSKMQDMNNYKDQVDSEDEFLDIFADKKLCFVLAVKDIGTNRRLTNIEQFTSNIAKFSLNDLIHNMRNLGIEFQVTQINEPAAP
jgi:uncharacterized protein (TIGR04141 family)